MSEQVNENQKQIVKGKRKKSSFSKEEGRGDNINPYNRPVFKIDEKRSS